MSPFADRVHLAIQNKKSCLCVGIDPTYTQLPKFLKNSKNIARGLTTYGELIIEAVSDSSAVVKPNCAFFEQFGLEGFQAFAAVCSAARKAGLLVIADAKRGDIGSTAEAYAAAFLDGANWGDKKIAPFECDALTVNASLGLETVEPFLNAAKRSAKGLFVLVRTSNPGAAALQEELTPKIANWVAKNSEMLRGKCGLSGLGAVVGATSPAMAKELRCVMPEAIFLVPGFGAQGGTAADALAGARAEGSGVLINASRAVVQPAVSAESEKQFVELVREAAEKLAEEIEAARTLLKT